MLNQANLIGRLGNDPEVRSTNSGTVANISLATSERWTDKNSGEKQERTEWHRVAFFGKLAEIVEKYLRKGSLIYVSGRIQTQKYEKDGETRYSTSIVANDMKMLPSRDDEGGGQRRERNDERQERKRPDPDPQHDFDDDVPF